MAACGVLFRFEEVTVAAGGTAILDDVSADLPGNGVTVVAGPSGSGKTTMLRLCNRLEVPTTGRVLFRGDDVAGLDPLALRRRVGMVFQRPTLFGGTVRDNLLVADAGAGQAEMEKVLLQAGLGAAFLDRRAGELSGGEAQRACLARTLLTGPEVLLLDEPTSALDAGLVEGFERMVGELVASGVQALWVTHDLAQLRRIAHHVVVLARGRLVHAGPPDEVDQTALGRLLSGAASGE